MLQREFLLPLLVFCLVFNMQPVAAGSKEENKVDKSGDEAKEEVSKEKIKINIEGIDKKYLKKVKNSLSIQQQKDHPRLSDGRMRKLYARGVEQIIKSLQAFGYYQATVEPSIDKIDQTWNMTYLVTTGERIKVGLLDLKISGEGSTDKAFLKLKKKFPLIENKSFRHSRYEKAKKSLQALASERGYFDAELIEHSVEIHLEEYTASVHIHMDTGKRYQFGATQFPLTVITPERLNQYLPYEEGDPYKTTRLISLQSELDDSDYFEEVEVRPQRDLIQNGRIPVKVNLTPRKRNRYTAGAGFGTDTGPRIKLGWLNRYVNSRGHRMSAETKLSPVNSNLALSYTVPHFRERNNELGFITNAARIDTDTSKSTSLTTGANHKTTRNFLGWQWNEVASLNYLIEDFEISSITDTSTLLLPGIGWTTLQTDNTTYTTNGFRLGFNLRGAYESLLSDVSLIQARVNGKYIRSFWKNGRVIARADLALSEVSDFNRLPTSLRYFAGGDTSIRGYDFEDLGPKDGNGEVIGGKHLAVASLEYEHRILEKWSLAAFFDAGNAFDKFGGDIEYGTGFGVRWLSPVGLVRIDLAMGISDPDKPIRLHIVIGPDL